MAQKGHIIGLHHDRMTGTSRRSMNEISDQSINSFSSFSLGGTGPPNPGSQGKPPLESRELICFHIQLWQDALESWSNERNCFHIGMERFCLSRIDDTGIGQCCSIEWQRIEWLLFASTLMIDNASYWNNSNTLLILLQQVSSMWLHSRWALLTER